MDVKDITYDDLELVWSDPEPEIHPQEDSILLQEIWEQINDTEEDVHKV